MRIVGYPGSFSCVARHAPVELTPQAQERLRLVQAWQRLRQRGLSGAEGAQVLRVSRASLYRGQKYLKALAEFQADPEAADLEKRMLAMYEELIARQQRSEML